jgi:hypothetical protein
MKLIEGIKLDIKETHDNHNVMINSGVNSEYNVVYQDLEYLDIAYTPIDDWNELDAHNKNLLFKNAENQKHYNKIIIRNIPENIKKILLDLKINESTERDEVFKKFAENPEVTLKIESEITNYLSKYSDNNDFKLYKILVLYPNRKTTALINFEDGIKYLGMHYDSCTTFEIETAIESKNRFCLNLGKEDRELYVINLSLTQIKNLILEKNSDEIIILDNLTPLFFKYYPNYPVLKLKIKPFQYYIAPTDNCIHEGTTLRKKEIDISITYLGYFTKI